MDIVGWATAKALEMQFRLNELETQHSEVEVKADALLETHNAFELEYENAMVDLRLRYRETVGRLAVYREILEKLGTSLEQETAPITTADTSATIPVEDTEEAKEEQDYTDDYENVANGGKDG